MTPNNLRLANLSTTAALAIKRGNPSSGTERIYAGLPPVPDGSTFEDYTNFIGLGSPNSVAMSEEDKLILDAANRKFAVYKGASVRDPTARYYNFGAYTNPVTNAEANVAKSLLDTLGSVAHIGHEVSPTLGALEDWTNLGQTRREANDLYSASLSPKDRERLTTPEGRKDIKLRDDVVQFAAGNAVGGLGARSLIGTMRLGGVAANTLLKTQNTMDAVGKANDASSIYDILTDLFSR